MKNGDCVTTKVIIKREMKYERFDFRDSLIPISFNRSAEIELEIMFKLKIKIFVVKTNFFKNQGNFKDLETSLRTDLSLDGT